MRRDIFDNKGFKTFDEPIGIFTRERGEKFERIGGIYGTVIVGSGLSNGAGAGVNSETADRYSVYIWRGEWDAAFPQLKPHFGMRFEVEKLGKLDVKSVQISTYEYICRCTQNMRAKEK